MPSPVRASGAQPDDAPLEPHAWYEVGRAFRLTAVAVALSVSTGVALPAAPFVAWFAHRRMARARPTWAAPRATFVVFAELALYNLLLVGLIVYDRFEPWSRADTIAFTVTAAILWAVRLGAVIALGCSVTRWTGNAAMEARWRRLIWRTPLGIAAGGALITLAIAKGRDAGTFWAGGIVAVIATLLDVGALTYWTMQWLSNGQLRGGPGGIPTDRPPSPSPGAKPLPQA